MLCVSSSFRLELIHTNHLCLLFVQTGVLVKLTIDLRIAFVVL